MDTIAGDGWLAPGDAEARDAYLEVMQNAYGACLDLQKRQYAQEGRWPEAPFWARRRRAEYCLETITA